MDTPASPTHTHQVPVPRGINPPAIPHGRNQATFAQPQQSLGVREILSILFKHKLKLAVFPILGLILAPIVYYLTPKVYQSDAYLMVKFGWEYMYSPQLAIEGSASPYARNEVLNSEVQILNSRDLKERILSNLGLSKIYPELLEKLKDPAKAKDAALLAMEENLSIKPAKNSSVIELSFEGNNPETVVEVLNQLIYYYSIKRLEIFKDPKAILFLEKKVAEYHQELRATEAAIVGYKQQNEVYSLGEQKTLLLGQKMGLTNSLMNTQNLIKELQQKLATLEKELSTIPKTDPNPDSRPTGENGLQSQLAALEIKEQELLGKYKESSQLVEGVRKQIEVLKDRIRKEAGVGGSRQDGVQNAVYQEVQKEIVKAKAELSSMLVTEKSLTEQVASLDEQVKSIDSKESRLRELERKFAIDEKNYNLAMKKLEESKVFDEMDRQKMTSVSVVQPATIPLKPIKPGKPLIIYIALGFLLGLGGACGLAFGLEVVAPTMRTPEDVEKRLHLTVLSSIPYKEAS